MAGRLDGKRAVVTGAGQGIGEAIARGLAREGAAVACLDVDDARARSTAGTIEQQGGDAVAVTCEVTAEDQVEASLATVIDRLGGVEVAVANAGGSRGQTCDFLALDLEGWQRMVDRNLTSVFLTGRTYGRHLAAAGGGAIVVVSSQLRKTVRPGLAHYRAAKGGVRQLARAMAVDLARHHVRVNAVAPGPTLTPGNRELFERPEVRATNEGSIPLGRLAEPHEMVGAVTYLASDEASYTTGTTLFVDGGYTIV